MSIKSISSSIQKWFISQSLNHSKRSIVISIITTLIIGSGVQFLVIDDDLMKMLPKKLDSRVSWDAVQKEFGSTEVIFVAFGNQNQSIYQKEILSDSWELKKELKELPSVESVINISTSTRIDNVDGFMEIADLQEKQLLNQDQIESLKKYLDKNIKLKKKLLNKNETFLLTIVQPKTIIGLDKFRNEVVSVSSKILSKYETHYSGTAYITGSIPQLIREDVQVLIQIGMLIMVSILLFNLRSLSGVLMVFMVIGLSLLAMLGSMGWLYKITGSEKFLFALLNTSMPIILLTIANSDGVHVVTKFFKEYRSGKTSRESINEAMESLLLPIFITSITTIAAFLTMASSPLEPLVGYGICISIGIAWAWLLSSITLPAIINLKKWNPTSKAFISHSIFENFVEYLGRVIVLYPRYIFSIGIVLFLLGSTGIYKVIVDVNLASFFKPGTEIRNSMDFMDQEMTGTMDLRIRLEAEMKEPSVLRKVDSLQYFIEKNKSISITSSISDVVKKMHRTVMNDSAKYDNIPVEREKVNNLFTMYAMSGNVEDFSSMVNYNNSIGLVTSLSRVMSTEEVFLFVNNISDYIKNHFNDTIKVNITGMIVVIRDMVTLIIRSSAISIVFSLFLVIMIASIFFKKIYWGVLAALPLSGAVILNFGLMGHFNVTLNHITAILSSIIIGVGIDFAIHFISQYQKLSKSVDRENLSEETIRDVGYPIVLDAASNMGFGALIFSSFVPVQYIGGLMIFAMISTALGTLIVLASLMEILKLYLIK
tara:strand:+ start:3984 stop:6284 length:2301 start_codon:yes stop_codon:yes gene_type:complete